ncbi:MAG TPA: PhaM family polyhydroxyalkanoate granule multifunctional regulatory protein [Burkholderiaceae bacterium]|nr:PhaM family polyhydroxyalkanoate granule multifunctional regulatory protein [Burkholderiaceae bacterium]
MTDSADAFDVGRMALGGFGSMLDTVEMMRRAMSSLAVPPSLAPTADVSELDKRIADLKAVEQWLNLNLGLLRGTIQGLEIQRGTIATVQAFGAQFLEALTPASPAARSGAAEPIARARAEDRPSAEPPTRPEPPPAGPAASAAARTREASAPAATAAGSHTEASAHKPTRRRTADETAAASAPGVAANAPLPAAMDPAAWWNMLQQNFSQVAQAALSGLPGGSADSAPAPELDSKPRRRASTSPGASEATGAAASGTPMRQRSASKRSARQRSGSAPGVKSFVPEPLPPPAQRRNRS